MIIEDSGRTTQADRVYRSIRDAILDGDLTGAEAHLGHHIESTGRALIAFLHRR